MRLSAKLDSVALTDTSQVVVCSLRFSLNARLVMFQGCTAGFALQHVLGRTVRSPPAARAERSVQAESNLPAFGFFRGQPR